MSNTLKADEHTLELWRERQRNRKTTTAVSIAAILLLLNLVPRIAENTSYELRFLFVMSLLAFIFISMVSLMFVVEATYVIKSIHKARSDNIETIVITRLNDLIPVRSMYFGILHYLSLFLVMGVSISAFCIWLLSSDTPSP